MSEQDDKLHDDRISKLYHLGSSGEPPAHLDNKIIDEAHRAASSWHIPWPSLATAAVLMLSFTLLLKVMEQQPLDQVLLPETVELDTATVPPPVVEGRGDMAVEEAEVAAPPAPTPASTPIATPKAKVIQHKQRSSVAPRRERKKAETESEMAPAVAPAPAARYNSPAPTALSVDSAAGAMQADEAVVAAPVAKAEKRVGGATAPKSWQCGAPLPAPELPAAAWQQLYTELLEQKKTAEAECLGELFEQRFGYSIKQ